MAKRNLDQYEIEALDINNAKLIRFDLDLTRRQLIFEVAGGRVQHGHLEESGPGVLTFANWSQIDVSVGEEGKEWSLPAKPQPGDKLKTLGEVTLHSEQVLLHGEGLRTGQWICYRLKDVKISATFEFPKYEP